MLKKLARKITISQLLAPLLFSSLCFPVYGEELRQVLIDTDMASDDWSAVLYVLNRKDIEVVGIIADGNGEARCDVESGKIAGAKNALGLASLAGRDAQQIPTACGAPMSLRGNHIFPDLWRDNVDMVFGLPLPNTLQVPDQRDAVTLITETIERAQKPIDILAIGPLTNIGKALQLKPELVRNIGMITIMGGAVNVPGNLNDPGASETDNKVAEWNIFIDPYAANLVLQSGAKIRLVPLDGTNYVPVSMPFLDKLNQGNKTPSSTFLHTVLSKQVNFIKTGLFFFWDTLAAVAVTNPEICRYERYPLRVVEQDGVESGRTKIDSTGYEVDVCTWADREKFENLFITALKS